jgi:hypothetical protein
LERTRLRPRFGRRVRDDVILRGYTVLAQRRSSRPAANLHRMSPTLTVKGKESGTARILGSGTSGMCYVATPPRTDQQLIAFGQT